MSQPTKAVTRLDGRKLNLACTLFPQILCRLYCPSLWKVIISKRNNYLLYKFRKLSAATDAFTNICSVYMDVGGTGIYEQCFKRSKKSYYDTSEHEVLMKEAAELHQRQSLRYLFNGSCSAVHEHLK